MNGNAGRTCADCKFIIASACPYRGALEHGYQCPVASKACLPEEAHGNCYVCSEWHDFFGCLYRGDMTLMGRLITALRCRINDSGTHGTGVGRVQADFKEA